MPLTMSSPTPTEGRPGPSDDDDDDDDDGNHLPFTVGKGTDQLQIFLI